MTTVINNPGEGSGNGAIIGIVIAVLVIILFFVFGLPYLRGNSAAPANSATGSIDVSVPGVGNGSANGSASGNGQ